jgi:HEAT repeat protein
LRRGEMTLLRYRNLALFVIFVIIVQILISWLMYSPRYWLLYRYNLWKLDRTQNGSEIEDINEEIRLMAEHIIPSLERTYLDSRQSEKRRGAAALALIKADRIKAENVFLSCIVSGIDDKTVSHAIYSLGLVGGKNAYPAVMKFLQSPNDQIREAVVNYLGEINMPKSVTLLEHIKENDPSNEVRNTAKYRLQLLGVLPMQ